MNYEKYKQNIEYTDKNKIQIDKIMIKIKEYKPLSWYDNLEKLAATSASIIYAEAGYHP